MNFDEAILYLKQHQLTWVITGVAGFIGSNLLEFLITHHQRVIGIDNFATGSKDNLDSVKKSVHKHDWGRFKFFELDITQKEKIFSKFKGVDIVLHQAALGSVPRSISNPVVTDKVNTNGFLNVITSAMESNVKKFVFAASSSTYGDHKALPKIESRIGKPLSPYAISKLTNELYAENFSSIYNFHSVGLRYFNVFGRRQNPYGAYAAVIPLWINSMISNEDIYINGDGSTSRDFCYIDNVIQANILASLSNPSMYEVYNVAFSQKNNLKKLFKIIRKSLLSHGICYEKSPIFREFREGDVKHSLASIEKASKKIGYNPVFSLEAGMKETVDWFIRQKK